MSADNTTSEVINKITDHILDAETIELPGGTKLRWTAVPTVTALDEPNEYAVGVRLKLEF